MRAIFGLMTTSLVLLAIVGFAWMHLRHTADSVELQSGPILALAKQAGNRNAQAHDAESPVDSGGTLETYFSKKGPVRVEAVHGVYKLTDHVGGSVAGTSLPILHDKFHVSVIVDLPFEVPAHAATPQLRGTFHSFLQAGGKPTSDTDADVEFRLLNDQEFSNFLEQKPSEAVFSADATHNAEVNASLPPTLDKAATYHMVFLNESRHKKVVQADFRIDF